MAGDLLYLSGNIGTDPATGKVARGLRRRGAAGARQPRPRPEGRGLGWEDVVKVNVYVEDMARYEEFNEIYTKTLPAPFPARTFLAVADLPGGGQIEIEAVAVRRK